MLEQSTLESLVGDYHLDSQTIVIRIDSRECILILKGMRNGFQLIICSGTHLPGIVSEGDAGKSLPIVCRLANSIQSIPNLILWQRAKFPPLWLHYSMNNEHLSFPLLIHIYEYIHSLASIAILIESFYARGSRLPSKIASNLKEIESSLSDSQPICFGTFHYGHQSFIFRPWTSPGFLVQKARMLITPRGSFFVLPFW